MNNYHSKSNNIAIHVSDQCYSPNYRFCLTSVIWTNTIFVIRYVAFWSFSLVHIDVEASWLYELCLQYCPRVAGTYPHNWCDWYVDCNDCMCLISGNLSWMRDELVGCYHLLLCCIDWFYINALLSHRKDLLNPNFKCKLTTTERNPACRFAQHVRKKRENMS